MRHMYLGPCCGRSLICALDTVNHILFRGRRFRWLCDMHERKILRDTTCESEN